MSKTNTKKHKNDYLDREYEDDQYSNIREKKFNKNKAKRINRALKIKDIDLLSDDEYIDEDDY